MHLAVGAGKDSILYLVNRDSMGKFRSNSNVYQQFAGELPGGFTQRLLISTTRSITDRSEVPSRPSPSATRSCRPVLPQKLSAASLIPERAPASRPMGRATPSYGPSNTNPAVLHAYDATNLNELYTSNQASGGRDQFGTGNKFITPMIANGKVFVGTPNGVAVFGPLPRRQPVTTVTSGLRAKSMVTRRGVRPVQTAGPRDHDQAVGAPPGYDLDAAVVILEQTGSCFREGAGFRDVRPWCYRPTNFRRWRYCLRSGARSPGGTAYLKGRYYWEQVNAGRL